VLVLIRVIILKSDEMDCIEIVGENINLRTLYLGLISKLHLNAKGSAILAVHFINFLKGGSASASPRKQRHQDFQRATIQKLGELLEIIVQPQKNIHRRKN
jgi:hypothetical protein